MTEADGWFRTTLRVARGATIDYTIQITRTKGFIGLTGPTGESGRTDAVVSGAQPLVLDSLVNPLAVEFSASPRTSQLLLTCAGFLVSWIVLFFMCQIWAGFKDTSA